jgi:hypothetical protein
MEAPWQKSIPQSRASVPFVIAVTTPHPGVALHDTDYKSDSRVGAAVGWLESAGALHRFGQLRFLSGAMVRRRRPPSKRQREGPLRKAREPNGTRCQSCQARPRLPSNLRLTRSFVAASGPSGNCGVPVPSPGRSLSPGDARGRTERGQTVTPVHREPPCFPALPRQRGKSASMPHGPSCPCALTGVRKNSTTRRSWSDRTRYTSGCVRPAFPGRVSGTSSGSAKKGVAVTPARAGFV